MKFKVVDFRNKWKSLKASLTEKDVEFFESTIDIEGTTGRVLTASDKDYNPRFMEYWFPKCRCHIGVVFPCWLLNGRKMKGMYKIITSDKHSAILNTATDEIFDPTYSANKVDPSITVKNLQGDYQVLELMLHTAFVDTDLAERLHKYSLGEK